MYPEVRIVDNEIMQPYYSQEKKPALTDSDFFVGDEYENLDED